MRCALYNNKNKKN